MLSQCLKNITWGEIFIWRRRRRRMHERKGESEKRPTNLLVQLTMQNVFHKREPKERDGGERESKLVWNWGFRDCTTELKERERERKDRERRVNMRSCIWSFQCIFFITNLLFLVNWIYSIFFLHFNDICTSFFICER